MWPHTRPVTTSLHLRLAPHLGADRRLRIALCSVLPRSTITWTNSNPRTPARLRREGHASTVGILICGSGNEHTVRYSLGNTHSPMAASTYTYESLPANEKASLPNADQLTAWPTTHVSIVLTHPKYRPH